MLNQLHTTSLRLIPYLEKNVDYDGLIIVSKNAIEDKGFMTHKSVTSAIEELSEIDSIHWKGEEKMFLNHIVDFDRGFFMIDCNQFFEDNIKSMYTRQILLFYNFLLVEALGEWHSVAIEEL